VANDDQEPPESSASAAPGADEGAGKAKSDPRGASSPPNPYGPPDDSGPPQRYGTVRYGPAGGYGAPGEYGADDPFRRYGAAGRYRAASAYGPEAYSPADASRAPDSYGPSADYDPADPYGPADAYGPEAYGTADFYSVPDTFVSPDAYGPASPPLPQVPGPEAAPPPGSGPGTRGPPGTAGPPRAPAPHSGDSGGGLTPEFLLPGRRRAPAPGWRRIIYNATGGLLRVPSSAAELRRQDMINRVRAPVAGGHHRVAVLSLKGGVGKTTTTVGLGATLASLRGDRVIAVDANPDRGTLSDKVRLETAATVRDLLNERGHIRRYADVRTFTSQAPSRLEVLASDRDPTVSVAFSDQDYSLVARVLEHYYSICVTDCGTGLLHSAMAGVLRLADQIVLVSSPSVDGARSASATLDWLAAHSYGDLVRNAVVVLSVVRPRSRSSVDLNRLEEHFASRCRAVVRIPYDSHLEEGAEVELDLLSRATADAYLGLAAVIGDGLAMPARARRA
jgi:MinD-like ATPase involved in chromosome partitioning or flagellar assembly